MPAGTAVGYAVVVSVDITSARRDCKLFVRPGPTRAMTASRFYLDHNATSPLRPAVAAACANAMTAYGNPYSIHREGRTARAAIETARSRVAALAGVEAGRVVFTSGGTEGNAMALRPGALRDMAGRPVRRLLAGAGEHASVLHGHGFASGDVGIVPLDSAGRVKLAALAESLRDDIPTLVSIQAANSETGCLQPIAEIAALTKASGGALHVDAVQAAGRIPLDAVSDGIAAMTVSSHKLGGPMGIGALIVAPDREGRELALIRGGGQERGRRAGTPNVAAIVGFGLAADIARQERSSEMVRLGALRDAAERGVRRLAGGCIVFCEVAARLPNTLAFAVPRLKAETALMALDLAGIAVSSGSACSSGKVGASHVLAAMGVPDDIAAGAIRVSFGWTSSETDLARFLEAFEIMLHRLYETRQARAA